MQEYQQFNFFSEMNGMSGSALSKFDEYNFFITHKVAKELIKKIKFSIKFETKQIFNLSPKLPQ